MVPAMTIYTVGKRKWIRYSGDICLCGYKHKGRQHRIPTGSKYLEGAARFRRELEAKYEAAESNKPVEQNQPVTVEQAIASFLADKMGGQKSKQTIAKYSLTLKRLLAFCTSRNVLFIRQITLQHLSEWRAQWDKIYSSVFALRNEQSRVRAFFTYCQKAKAIDYNYAKDLSPIKLRDEDFRVDPFSNAEVKRILAAIDKTEITPANKERVKLLMLVQRWAGLSLIDAVTLERNELVQVGRNFRIDCSRRKTGTRVSVPIPGWLGKALLRLTNNNAQYFFSSGAPRATSYFDKAYRNVFKTAGVPDGTSHRWRHTFAVSALEAGADLRTVSKALGHRNLTVTEKFYASFSEKQQQRMEKELAAAWKQ
jgi:integrase